jgi:PAS domain S-box-containing protein
MPFANNATATISGGESGTKPAEPRMRAVFDTMPDGVMLLAADGRIIDANPVARGLMAAASPAETAVTSLLDLTLPESRAALRTYLDDALAGLAAAIEFELATTQGERRRIEMRAAALQQGETAFLAVCRDITEQRRMEAQIRHLQKMDAVGTLSAGIAHDFNNILTAVIGYANILKLKLKPGDPLRTHVEQILVSSERATSFTQSLLVFSGKTAVSLRSVSINDEVKRSEKMLRALTGEGIELVLSLAERATTVIADPGQIGQILIQLTTNARDAMPDGGSLTIATDIRAMGDDFIRAHGFGKTGDYVILSVSDSGTGMDETTRQRIFQPFFTTKETGKGSGLGLAIVYGIAKQHRGYIICLSEEGRGTTFNLYLPLTKQSSLDYASATSIMPAGGTETILLAEGDIASRKMTASYLRDFGYTVVEASSGAEAIRAFSAERNRVRLIVIDLDIGADNAKAAADAVLNLAPGTKMLFMSDWNAMSGAGNEEEAGRSESILKPVSPDTLLRKVREVLDR